MKTKTALDREVAELTKVPSYVVKQVTAAWLDVIRDTLISEGVAQLHTVGTLTVYPTTGGGPLLLAADFGKNSNKVRLIERPVKVFVNFRKAALLRKELRKKYVLPKGDDHEQPRQARRRND